MGCGRTNDVRLNAFSILPIRSALGPVASCHPISTPTPDVRPSMAFTIGTRVRNVVAEPLALKEDFDMFPTCLYAIHMSTMIQLRHVPDDLHRKLKARAALAGMSLSDYLLREIRDIAERPTIAELRTRLDRRTSVRPTLSPAKAVRAERDGR